MCTRLNTLVLAGFWKEHFHWLSPNFLRWGFLFALHPSIQSGNKWPVGHFKRRCPSFKRLHGFFLLLSLLFCACHYSKCHLPLSPCTKLTPIIAEGIFGRLEWQRVGAFSRAFMWVWEWSSIHGWSGSWICSSWFCPGMSKHACPSCELWSQLLVMN